MKKKYIITMLLSAFCLLYIMQVLAGKVSMTVKTLPKIDKGVGAVASRAYAPEVMRPLIYKDMRIVSENNSQNNMGIVQAFNVNTNKLIWSSKVYKVEINPNIEEDVQWVFIKEMKIENDKLVVINENLERYTLDPDTGKVMSK